MVTVNEMPTISARQLILEQSKTPLHSTGAARDLLLLSPEPEHNYAANFYWNALDLIREQRVLAAQLAHVAMQAKTEMNRLGNILNWSADIPKSYAAAMNAISNQFETGAVDAARKAGIL